MTNSLSHSAKVHKSLSFSGKLAVILAGIVNGPLDLVDSALGSEMLSLANRQLLLSFCELKA